MLDVLKAYLERRKLRRLKRDFRRQIRATLTHDDDILPNNAKKELHTALADLGQIDESNAKNAYERLEKISNRVENALPIRSNRTLRDYADILAVALTVAFGLRAVYVQPFKIPTSSMQPTLFGIHYVEKEVVPSVPQPLNYSLYSTQRAKLEIKKSGEFDQFLPASNQFLILPQTAFAIAGVDYHLPGVRDKVLEYAFRGLDPTKHTFTAGETLCDGWLSLGDHLFVDRLSYHFREPRRGDIVVFTTEGIVDDQTMEPLTARGFYYVKRLVGLPGETLKVVDCKLQVKAPGADTFRPLADFGIKQFDRIYSGKGGYHGHLPVGRLAAGREVEIPADSYFMMGDNSAHSSDSRCWGFVPRRNIVGRALVVFWPVSRRWGLVDRADPLPEDTTLLYNRSIPAMRKQ